MKIAGDHVFEKCELIGEVVVKRCAVYCGGFRNILNRNLLEPFLLQYFIEGLTKKAPSPLHARIKDFRTAFRLWHLSD